MSSEAIGIFDSGVGGLTVLRELKRRWPGENFIYLADTARLPYGGKSLQTIHNYAEQNVRNLLKFGVKAVIVACNSASAAILEKPLSCPVPLLNVIEPGARKALQISKTKRIGVLGTRATVFSEAYVHALRRLDTQVQIAQQACPLWVPLVEEGWIDDPITNLVVYRYLSAIGKHQADTLILGCTHYPALRNAIKKVVGHSVELIDSSLGLIEDLEKLKICREDPDRGKFQLYCTDFSPRLEETFRLLLDGVRYDSLETLDLT